MVVEVLLCVAGKGDVLDPDILIVLVSDYFPVPAGLDFVHQRLMERDRIPADRLYLMQILYCDTVLYDCPRTISLIRREFLCNDFRCIVRCKIQTHPVSGLERACTIYSDRE